MKYSKVLSGLRVVMAWAISLPAFGEGTTLGEISQAAQRSGDKSRQALVAMYGNVVNNPLATGSAGGGDTILASLFQVTNGALLVIGAIFTCYMMFLKVSQTAHDGAVFDRAKNTMWGPIRIVWGLASLVPTANGWSLSQLLMLWAASVMGVGVANMGVDVAVSAFNDGKAMVLQPVMPSTNELAHKIFEMELCRHGINAGLATASSEGGLVVQGDPFLHQLLEVALRQQHDAWPQRSLPCVPVAEPGVELLNWLTVERASFVAELQPTCCKSMHLLTQRGIPISLRVHSDQAKELRGAVANWDLARLVSLRVGGYPRKREARHRSIRNGLDHRSVTLVEEPSLHAKPDGTGLPHKLSFQYLCARKTDLAKNGMREGHIVATGWFRLN